MSSRRAWQLQQLGIIHYSLRRPAALQGEIALTLPASVRLVIVSPTLSSLQTPFLRDVLLALRLDDAQVLLLPPERVAMLPENSRCNSWWLGCDGAGISGRRLVTPPLASLEQDSAARRALWQQICDYEDDFFTQPG